MKQNSENRYLYPWIKKDLERKMVLLAGPRQVGKTTLALSYLPIPNKESAGYLNWDAPVDRAAILKLQLPTPAEEPILVLDEIHKYKPWRNYLKGLFDKRGPKQSFLVTGSARLDHYRRGGDSMLGRYHFYRLHPFSLAELAKKTPSPDDLKALLRLGGFPEPLFEGTERFHRRWQKERISLILKEDLRDLELVRDISLLELLMHALPDRVGAPLSIKNLSQELQVSFQTVERWITIFERLYLCFRIPPYGSPKIRAVKKEQKLYFWDWSQCHEEGGARLENLVASQLLKFCHYQEDVEGYAMELRFLRDIEKREIDFVVLKDRKPLFAVECKTGDRSLASSIPYFAARTPIPAFYQVHLGTRHYAHPESRAEVLPFHKFCSQLEMP